jgi:hypothetical protein
MHDAKYKLRAKIKDETVKEEDERQCSPEKSEVTSSASSKNSFTGSDSEI